MAAGAGSGGGGFRRPFEAGQVDGSRSRGNERNGGGAAILQGRRGGQRRCQRRTRAAGARAGALGMPAMGRVTIMTSAIVMKAIMMLGSCFLLRGKHGGVVVMTIGLHGLVAACGRRRLRTAQQHRGRGEALEGHAGQQKPQQQCTEQLFHGAPW